MRRAIAASKASVLAMIAPRRAGSDRANVSRAPGEVERGQEERAPPGSGRRAESRRSCPARESWPRVACDRSSSGPFSSGEGRGDDDVAENLAAPVAPFVRGLGGADGVAFVLIERRLHAGEPKAPQRALRPLSARLLSP